MKKLFFPFLLLSFVALPGESRQLSGERPQGPLILKAKIQNVFNAFASSKLERLVDKLQSFSLSPLVGEVIIWKFTFQTLGRRYTGHITQSIAVSRRALSQLVISDPPKVPP